MSKTLTQEEIALYNELKTLPDFESLPLPSHWFKAFNIPPVSAITPKEFMASGYTFKKMYEPKDLPPIIINEPQQGGKLVKMVEEEPIKVEVKSRPFVMPEGGLTILPSLLEDFNEPSSSP
jgi:hypothetical protein